MTCKVPKEKLISYILNELSEDESLQINEHISNCDNCLIEIAELDILKDAWEKPRYFLLSDNFSNSVMNNLPSKKYVFSLYHNNKFESICNFAIAYVATYLFIYFDAIQQVPNIANKFSSIITESENALLINSINGITWFDKLYFQFFQFFQ